MKFAPCVLGTGAICRCPCRLSHRQRWHKAFGLSWVGNLRLTRPGAYVFCPPFWFCRSFSLTPASGLWGCALLPNDAGVWIGALPVSQTPCSPRRTPFFVRIYFQAQPSSFKEALATLKLRCILHSDDYGIQAPVPTDIFPCDLQGRGLSNLRHCTHHPPCFSGRLHFRLYFWRIFAISVALILSFPILDFYKHKSHNEHEENLCFWMNGCLF